MKKIFTLLVFALCFSANTNAQLANGATLSSNVYGIDVITQDSVDVFKTLDEGKAVIIDIFATWCGPCWSFHNSGFLKDYYTAHGPEGDNTVMVLAIEGDGSTAGSTLTSSSLGNWLEGVNYPIIDTDQFDDGVLEYGYFPTVYIITPDRKVTEVGSYRYQTDFYDAIIENATGGVENDLGLLSFPSADTYCGEREFEASVLVGNFGVNEVSSATIDLVINGEVAESKEVTTGLSALERTTVEFAPVTLSSEAVVTYEIVSVNGVADANDKMNDFSGAAFSFPVSETVNMTLNFTTDFYPVETAWTLRDGNLALIASDSYTGTANGGGANSFKTFTYNFDVPATTDLECLRLTITDSYGDGLSGWNSSSPVVPGAEILDGNGNVVKAVMTSDWNFASTNQIDFGAVGALDIPEISNVEKFAVSPNPAIDFVNVELSFTESKDYSIFVQDFYGKRVANVATNISGKTFNDRVNVSELAAGVYFIYVTSEEGVQVQKFIKQ